MASGQIMFEGQFRRETVLDAGEALKLFGIRDARIRPLGKLWNRTFEVRTQEGERLMLRIHPAESRKQAELRSELAWLNALAEETDLSIPRPRICLNGEWAPRFYLTGSTDSRLCCLFEWVDGRFLDRGLKPDHMCCVGRTLAGLHNHAEQWVRPEGFTRERVDKLNPSDPRTEVMYDDAELAVAERVAGEVLSVEDVDIVLRSILRVRAAIAQFAPESAEMGLIHADLHQRNYLFKAGRAGVIDFDDCGFGPWLYDFGVALNELNADRADYLRLRSALLEGYREARNLSEYADDAIEGFVRLRQIQNVLSLINDRRDPELDGLWQKWVGGELHRLRNHVVQ